MSAGGDGTEPRLAETVAALRDSGVAAVSKEVEDAIVNMDAQTGQGGGASNEEDGGAGDRIGRAPPSREQRLSVALKDLPAFVKDHYGWEASGCEPCQLLGDGFQWRTVLTDNEGPYVVNWEPGLLQPGSDASSRPCMALVTGDGWVSIGAPSRHFVGVLRLAWWWTGFVD
jgi:hypothetical protein